MAAISEQAKANQRKYKQEFAKQKYKRIPLDLPIEYAEYVKALAKNSGLSITAYIKSAIDEKNDNVKDELPPELIPNAIKWLRDHGHTDSEVVDFLYFIGEKENL